MHVQNFPFQKCKGQLRGFGNALLIPALLQQQSKTSVSFLYYKQYKRHGSMLSIPLLIHFLISSQPPPSFATQL